MLDVGGMILLIYKYLILCDTSAVKLQIWAVTCMNANFERCLTMFILMFLSSMG